MRKAAIILCSIFIGITIWGGLYCYYEPMGILLWGGSDHSENFPYVIEDCLYIGSDNGTMPFSINLNKQPMLFSPDGKTLVIRSDYTGEIIKIYYCKIDIWQECGEYQSNRGMVSFAPDSRFLVFNNLNGINMLKRTENGYEKNAYLSGHKYDINTIAFSRDSQFMASSSNDTLIIWQQDDKGLWKKHSEVALTGVRSIDFSPDNKRMVALTLDGEKTVVNLMLYEYADNIWKKLSVQAYPFSRKMICMPISDKENYCMLKHESGEYSGSGKIAAAFLNKEEKFNADFKFNEKEYYIQAVSPDMRYAIVSDEMYKRGEDGNWTKEKVDGSFYGYGREFSNDGCRVTLVNGYRCCDNPSKYTCWQLTKNNKWEKMGLLVKRGGRAHALGGKQGEVFAFIFSKEVFNFEKHYHNIHYFVQIMRYKQIQN